MQFMAVEDMRLDSSDLSDCLCQSRAGTERVTLC